MTTTVARPEPALMPPAKPSPPLIHLFRPRWWEGFLPKKFWRIRKGDRALCGATCKWNPPRGPTRVQSEVCIVCRELSRNTA